MNKYEVYTIIDKIRIAIEQAEMEAENNNGEIGNVLAQYLEQLNIEKNDIIKNLALEYKNNKYLMSNIKSEIEALKDRAYYVDKKMIALKKALESLLQGEKYIDEKTSISWRVSSSVVEEPFFFSIDAIPSEYIKTTVEKVLLKDKIKQAILSGVKIEGLYIDTKKNIQIK